jgi:arylsulfatase
MKLSRRNAIIAAALATSTAAGTWYAMREPSTPRLRTAKASGRRFNVLFVLSDQERAWSLYPEGFIEKHTPARQWLRENGVEFTAFQSNSTLCSPARGVIYSGVHSQNNGVFDNAPLMYVDALRRDVPTLGTLFQDAGYITGCSGKWHLSKMPDERDTTPEAARAINATIRSYGFDETDNREETDGPLFGWQKDARTVDRALKFVRRRENDEEPWFLAVNLLNPHDIMYYTAGEEMTASRVSQFPDASARPPIDDPIYAEDLGYPLADNYGPATLAGRPAGVVEYGLTFSAAMGTMPYDDLAAGREMQNYYWNCTRDSDRHVQALLDGLKASGAMENTIIVFTSDHGELLGVHGLRGKGTAPYREASNVPAIIVHPDGRRGQAHGSVLSQVDLAPTLLAMAGVPRETLTEQMPMLTGRDFSSLVFDPSASGPRAGDDVLLHWTPIAFQSHEAVQEFGKVRQKSLIPRLLGMKEIMEEAAKKRGQMRGLHDGKWKFARYSTPLEISQPGTLDALLASHDLELYDLEADPGEINNLARDPQRWANQLTDCNTRLNALIRAEVGKDDGDFLPLFVKV